MAIFNFSYIFALIWWICVFVTLNLWGFLKKSSKFNLITLIISVLLLILHISFKNSFGDSIVKNLITDFSFMIVSIFMYLYIDEIESRRKVISEVFENKYKNK